jgi:NAD(P)-dependent dehydrogenase (short-subunit alcohol dehydrogenase family)
LDLPGRVALVTGGASGTGAAVARRLASDGARVVVADLDAESGEAVAADLGDAAFVRVDLTRPADVGAMVDRAVQLGGLHVLVNAAGGYLEPTFPEAPLEHWGATLDLNLRAPMLATQLCLEPMRRAGGGVVVNVASTAALGAESYASPEYGAAKAGLVRFTTSLSDLGERMNVRVNCLVPDWIETERARRELAAMSDAERGGTAPPLPMDQVVDAILELIADDGLAGAVRVMRPG